ncbi:MAG: choice-of-anchor tandem repeat GloVer-containing protein [Saprospiraceae bacterium]
MKNNNRTSTCSTTFFQWTSPLWLSLLFWINPTASSVWAQPNTLYGYGSEGGAQGYGTIYKVQSGSITKVFDFSKTEGANPVHATLMQASNGKLYGATGSGGANDFGVLFEYDPVAAYYSALYSFDYPTGAAPIGRLVESSGKLYGMTSFGGPGERGVIFEYDLGTQAYSVAHTFSNNGDAADPKSGLTELGGVFYGTTYAGGSESSGVLFRFDPSGNAYQSWHSFGAAGGGKRPVGSLAVMGGKLYGTTESGGANESGVIFEFDPGPLAYQELYDFDGTGGSRPLSALTPNAGTLYGTTNQGGSNSAGVLFSYDSGTDTYTPLHDFDFPDGAFPEGDLTLVTGKLYGMTMTGGNGSSGVLYEYDLGTNAYQALQQMAQVNTGNSQNGLLELGGLLYGLTSSPGLIYSYEISSAMFTPLVNFLGADQGRAPRGRLLEYAGKLYGTTEYGGLYDGGVLYEINPTNNAYSVLHHFDKAGGSRPSCGLTELNGKLYGMTENGDPNVPGVLFEYDLASSTFQVKRFFNVLTDGGYAVGNLLARGNNLLGITHSGGPNSGGTLFEYAPNANTLTVKHAFNVADGNHSAGSLMAVNDKLYGMSGGGSFNKGVLFEYDQLFSQFQVRHHFDLPGGAYPNGDLTYFNGKLYGLTPSSTGTNAYGNLFEFDPASGAYTVRHWFDGTNGSYPNGSLILSGSKLYGVTLFGGANDAGVVFEFDPATSTFAVVDELDGANNGMRPQYAQLTALDADNADDDGDGYSENTGDCEDRNAAIYPGATEICNNMDDDCNGLVDDGGTCAVYCSNNGFPIYNLSMSPNPANGTDFGPVPVGGSTNQAYAFGNLSMSVPLALTGSPLVTISGQHAADFTVTAMPATPVPPNGTSPFTVQFHPSASGYRWALVVITHDNLPQNPFVFMVEGVGQ